ncbi:MAG: aldose epimerase [Phormidium sp. BM_Day4_Bin.17]|nr:aldose epimerase [Phormidium sp. BM_Day4_Bin.17]UCJ10493.1 MAG: aldose epimerase [Phormidium sp. PBR-2020]
MYAIATETKLYPTYILSDDSAQAQLEIVPERGGLVTRWQVGDRDILYFDAERFANPELSVRGGIPILFPICGNLPNNTYTHEGTSYSLKQHGFARDLPWTVGESRTDKSASLTLELASNEETLAVYPFEFHLSFTYRLHGHTLEIVQRYSNPSEDQILPFSCGLHPYFQVPDKSQLRFHLPSHQYWDQLDGTLHDFDNRFNFERKEIDVAFTQLQSQSASVYDCKQGFTLNLEYSTPFSTLVFWAVQGKDYYCLEPWSAPRNALNTGDRLIHVHPRSSLEMLVRLDVHLD